jgi:hypothetical protein
VTRYHAAAPTASLKAAHAVSLGLVGQPERPVKNVTRRWQHCLLGPAATPTPSTADTPETNEPLSCAHPCCQSVGRSNPRKASMSPRQAQLHTITARLSSTITVLAKTTLMRMALMSICWKTTREVQAQPVSVSPNIDIDMRQGFLRREDRIPGRATTSHR